MTLPAAANGPRAREAEPNRRLSEHLDTMARSTTQVLEAIELGPPSVSEANPGTGGGMGFEHCGTGGLQQGNAQGNATPPLEGLECIGYQQFATSVLEIIQSTLVHQVLTKSIIFLLGAITPIYPVRLA